MSASAIRFANSALAIQSASNTLRRAGLPVPAPDDCLGFGYYSYVYRLDDDRVVKVTTDYSDAMVAERARRAQANGGCRNLMRVFNVWRIRSNYPLYCIVAERLQVIPRELFERYNLPTYWYDLGDSKVRCLVKAAARWAVEPFPPLSKWNPLSERYEVVPWNVWGFAALNIKGIADDLRSIGVEAYNDFHYANIMLRPGDRVVASDFGCSSSPHIEIEEGC